MQRSVTLIEEHGIYRLISTSGVRAQGATLLSVLVQASTKAEGPFGGTIRIDKATAELLEGLLGERRDGDHGQIQKGVQSA